MDRRAAIVVLTGTLVAVVFAAVATGGEVKLAERAPQSAIEPAGINSPVATVPPVTTVSVRLLRRRPVRAAAVDRGGRAHAVLGLRRHLCDPRAHLGVATPAASALARHAGGSPSSSRCSTTSPPRSPLTPTLKRAALQHGSPRNAIVECWLRLETAVVDAGVRRDPADTSTELTMRVLATRHVDPAAIASLAALYRGGRFSDHAMGEDDRAGGDRGARRGPRRAAVRSRPLT